jgi:hypothetical protein
MYYILSVQDSLLVIWSAGDIADKATFYLAISGIYD